MQQWKPNGTPGRCGVARCIHKHKGFSGAAAAACAAAVHSAVLYQVGNPMAVDKLLELWVRSAYTDVCECAKGSGPHVVGVVGLGGTHWIAPQLPRPCLAMACNNLSASWLVKRCRLTVAASLARCACSMRPTSDVTRALHSKSCAGAAVSAHHCYQGAGSVVQRSYIVHRRVACHPRVELAMLATWSTE